MSSLRKAGFAVALISAGPLIWSMAWTILFPSFLLIYYEYYKEWTGTVFQNYLVVGIAGIYVIAGILAARFGETKNAPIPKQIRSTGCSESESKEKAARPDPPPAPSPQSSPQLSEIMEGLRDLGKRMEGIEASQKRISPFLKLGTPTEAQKNE